MIQYQIINIETIFDNENQNSKRKKKL